MAATDTVGQVQAIYLNSVDNLGTQYETNINGRSTTVNPNATYEAMNDAMRVLNSLTTNTYIDTKLITAISVNEKIAEE